MVGLRSGKAKRRNGGKGGKLWCLNRREIEVKGRSPTVTVKAWVLTGNVR